MEAAEGEEEEEEEDGQEQRHPNGSGAASGRKQEGRATRSRVATGRGLPLVPAAGSGEERQSAEGEAADLLSTLGSLLSAPQLPAGTPLGAPSPLLRSPASRAPGAGAGGEGQQGGTDAAAAGQQEEADVKAFLKRLPSAGVGRQDLAMQLLGALCTASAAAQLSPAVRYQLLQVAHQAQHSVPQLPPTHCLVLGELFADAAAAAAEAGKQRVGGGLTLGSQGGTAVAAAAAPKPGGADTSPQAPGRTSGVARRPSARAKRLELSLLALQQSARLWLARYRLAAAEGSASCGPLHAEPAAGQAAAEQLPAGMVRYWWATGRLLESEGDMVAARAAYATCEQGLPMLQGECCAVVVVGIPKLRQGAACGGMETAVDAHYPWYILLKLRSLTCIVFYIHIPMCRQPCDLAATLPSGRHHQRRCSAQQAGGAAAALCARGRTAQRSGGRPQRGSGHAGTRAAVLQRQRAADASAGPAAVAARHAPPAGVGGRNRGLGPGPALPAAPA